MNFESGKGSRQTRASYPWSPSRQRENPRENLRHPSSDEKFDISAEDAPTPCSRSRHGHLGRSIRVGPTPQAPGGPRLPPNPEWTPPTSTPSALGANFVFRRRSRTRGATTSGFRPSSPPRRPLPAQQRYKVRQDVSDAETASHPIFSRSSGTSGRPSGSSTTPTSSATLKTPTRKRSKIHISNRKWRYSTSKGPSTTSPRRPVPATGSFRSAPREPSSRQKARPHPLVHLQVTLEASLQPNMQTLSALSF